MDIKTKYFTFTGESIGGIGSSISVPELDLSFDLGIVTRASLRTNRIFISHAHADHFGGILKYLAVRDLFGMNSSEIFIPSEIAEDAQEIISSFERMQNKRFRFSLIPISEGKSYPLKKNFTLVPFCTFHSITTYGALITRKKTKLKEEFSTLSSSKIVKLKGSGTDIFIEEEIPEICYTPDTSIEIVEKNEFIRKSRILIIETTFLDPKKDIEKAHLGKHVHLDEIILRAADFENEVVILFHFSQIYTNDEIKTIIRQRLPEEFLKKVSLLLPDDRYRL